MRLDLFCNSFVLKKLALFPLIFQKKLRFYERTWSKNFAKKMLKGLVTLGIYILCLAPLSLQGAIDWQTDYQSVKVSSLQQHKPILVFFNGSDWAGPAMKMKHEILSASAFQEKIGERFVCIEADFPRHTSLSLELEEQNRDLKDRFNIQDLPTLLLLDPAERVIAQVNYLPDSGAQLAEDLLKIVELDKELQLGLQNLSAASSQQLKKLYQLAQELSSDNAVECIQQAGINAKDPFFCIERYRLLAEKGEMKGSEALNLRQKLGSCPLNETVNGQPIPFTLALIDFQALSQQNYEPEMATLPLVDYIARYGEIDKKNIWRLEMTIAEAYLDADKWDEALKHAEKAYWSAPENMHEELAHSLDYIRSIQR